MVCVNWICMGFKCQKPIFGSDALGIETGNKFKVRSMVLTKCYSIAIIRGHVNVRIAHGSPLLKEPETDKTTMTTFCLYRSKKSLGLGIIFSVAPTVLGGVVRGPWEGFPYCLWLPPPLYWDIDHGTTKKDPSEII